MVDESKIGFEFPSYTLVVDKTKIAEFAAAVELKDNTREIKPIYYDENAAKEDGYRGIPVPLTFMTSFFFLTGGLAEIVKTLDVDLGKLLHGEEEYEYFSQIYAGDVITGKMKVMEIYGRGKKNHVGRFVNVAVLETKITNQSGKLVGKVRSTMIER